MFTAALQQAATTRDVQVGVGVLDALPAVLDRTGLDGPVLVVADENTWRAAGRRVADLLAAAGRTVLPPVLLPGTPRVKAAAETAQALATSIAGKPARKPIVPIAVGSGVLNDIVKYAAELTNRPYVCVPTAASMDGYAASGAALREGGFKRTFACAAPRAIVADLDVIATAPPEMAAWGYGDLVGKHVAGADWVLADALGLEPINPRPYGMVQDNLADWLARPAEIRQGDRAALDGLVRGLIMAGLAMQAHGNSRPASGSDHQFAHLWEMEELSQDGLPVSHGACVGIGCLSMLSAYEWLLQQDIAAIAPATLAARQASAADLRAEIAAAFPLAFMAANAEVETLAKAISPEAVETRLRRLQSVWPTLSMRLRTLLPRSADIRQRLQDVGAPAAPAAIGVASAQHRADYRRARLIRRRFTALDLLHDLGWLDRAADAFNDKACEQGRAA